MSGHPGGDHVQMPNTAAGGSRLVSAMEHVDRVVAAFLEDVGRAVVGALYKSNPVETHSLTAPGATNPWNLKCDFPGFKVRFRMGHNLNRYVEAQVRAEVASERDGALSLVVGAVQVESSRDP
jgi:hypothetical protein